MKSFRELIEYLSRSFLPETHLEKLSEKNEIEPKRLYSYAHHQIKCSILLGREKAANQTRLRE